MMSEDAKIPIEAGSPSIEGLHPDQLRFAKGLGLEPQENESVPAFILRIEQTLGQDSLLELARWFLFSVMRHLRQEGWQSLGDSGVEREAQYQLAAKFIAEDEHKQSLLVVLKDFRFRFVLLSFAKGRDPEQRILSSTTKAFRHARDILIQYGLVDARIVGRRGRRPAQASAPAVNTVSNRRAARRAISPSPARSQSEEKSTAGEHKLSAEMSEEEFAELDKALDGGKSEDGQPWTYHSNDERVSLLLGALAGATLFVVALWIFF